MGQKGLVMAVFGSQYILSPYLFDHADIDFPMTLHSWLSNVGRTSMDIYRILETADSERKVLLSGVVRNVCMDTVRGNSVPFPNPPQRHVSSVLPPTVGLRRFPTIKVPESSAAASFLTTIRVRYDDMRIRIHYADIDHNWHTTQSSYMVFALECAARAAAAGYYSRIRGDIAFYRALSWTCVHLGESFAEDELQVSTWEDVNNALLLHFLVNRQQRRICYIEIEFGENTIASKL